MADVNWRLLSEALDFYAARGSFSNIDVPWAIPTADLMVTCPSPALIHEAPRLGGLVGSAEQSLVAISRNGTLKPGRWMSITPCFRVESSHDNLRRPYFMKLELFDSSTETRMPFQEMARLAREFFLTVGRADNDILKLVTTEAGLDIEIAGIEVGSYGARIHDGFSWNYGTGLAEPRFSSALEEATREEMDGPAA